MYIYINIYIYITPARAFLILILILVKRSAFKTFDMRSVEPVLRCLCITTSSSSLTYIMHARACIMNWLYTGGFDGPLLSSISQPPPPIDCLRLAHSFILYIYIYFFSSFCLTSSLLFFFFFL